MDGGSDCHSSNGTIWSRLTRFFGREDDESLEKAIIVFHCGAAIGSLIKKIGLVTYFYFAKVRETGLLLSV